MGSGLLPENVTSLLKQDLVFPQYSSFTTGEVVVENHQHAKLDEARFCNLFSNQSSFHYLFICLLSNKDGASFLLHYPCPAEVSFHVLPRPVVCQAAWWQARRSLPTHPPSRRLLNNAICPAPLTRSAPFTVSSQSFKEGTQCS